MGLGTDRREGLRAEGADDVKVFALAAPGAAEFRETVPPCPGPDEVLVRVRAVGLCGSDLNTWRGRNPLVTYPRVPGHEIAGEIVEAGADVPAEWAPGAKVTLSPYSACGRCPACRRGRANACRDNRTMGVQRDGGLAESIVVPWPKLFASPKLSFRELALVEPLSVGRHAVNRGRVTPEDTVAVLGCGMIGLGAVAGAADLGARVIAVDIDDAKLDLARKVGAAETVNSRAASLGEALAALTDGDGPDVIVEAVGLPETYRAAVENVTFAGRVVYIGYAKAPVEFETKRFVQKELDLLGSRNAMPDDFRQVIRALETGVLPTVDLVTRTYPFDSAAQALADWDADPAAITKLLVEVGAE